jgi:hypothetical protein
MAPRPPSAPSTRSSQRVEFRVVAGSAPLQWRSYFGMRLMHSATSCNPSAAAVVRKMTSNVFRRIIAAIGDSFRITKAFDMAARGEYEKALNVLNRLGQHTRHLYRARLLRGALYSHLAMHERAVIELASAAQTIKADKRFSKAESNYLVAYAVQYWRHSAWEIGLHEMTKETEDAPRVEAPIDMANVPAHLRRKFPLKVPLAGIEIT